MAPIASATILVSPGRARSGDCEALDLPGRSAQAPRVADESCLSELAALSAEPGVGERCPFRVACHSRHQPYVVGNSAGPKLLATRGGFVASQLSFLPSGPFRTATSVGIVDVVHCRSNVADIVPRASTRCAAAFAFRPLR